MSTSSKTPGSFGRRVAAMRGARRARSVAGKPLDRLDPYHRPDGRELVVALAVSGEQLPTLEPTLRTLLDQTVRPSRIAVYLDPEVAEEDLSNSLLSLVPLGVTVTWAPEGGRPGEALRLACGEHPFANIVTAVPGRLYPATLVETLLRWHRRFPEAVVARRAVRLTFSETGELGSCAPWVWSVSSGAPSPRADAVALGESGVLYPPASLSAEALAEEASRAPQASEDAWLKVQEARHGVPCLVVPGAAGDVSCAAASDVAVAEAGSEGATADALERTLRALVKAYGLSSKDFRQSAAPNGSHLAWSHA